MAEQVSFWRRVGNLFHGSAVGSGGRVGNGSLFADDDGSANADSTADLAAVAKTPGWRRPGAQIQMRDASQRIVDLADSMQQHFRQQDEHAANLARSLERVGGVLEQLAEGQRAQSECLRTIATQTEAANRHASGLADMTSRIPEALLTQAEAIRGVARQLEASQASDEQLLLSLKSFSQAADTLGSAGTAQVETLRRMNTVQSEQHEAFSTLVREQSRRFLFVIGVAGALALASLGTLLFLVFSRPLG